MGTNALESVLIGIKSQISASLPVNRRLHSHAYVSLCCSWKQAARWLSLSIFFLPAVCCFSAIRSVTSLGHYFHPLCRPLPHRQREATCSTRHVSDVFSYTVTHSVLPPHASIKCFKPFCVTVAWGWWLLHQLSNSWMNNVHVKQEH